MKKNIFMYGSIIILSILLVMVVISCSSSFELSIGGSENMKLLEELNVNWVLDEKYEIEEIKIEEMKAFWIREKEVTSTRVILQLHGGAYRRDLYYRQNLYERMAEQYKKVSNYDVLSIDYRVTPDNPYPAALEDATMAYNYLLKLGYSNEDIIIAGDSTGGGLALALVLYLRDNAILLPKGIITISAWTDLDYKRKVAYVGNEDLKNPYISPIYGDFTGFPPMLMQVGTKDITNDTVQVAEKAKESGVLVTQSTYLDMPHVFQALFPEIPKANRAWDEVEEFIKNL